VVSVKAFVETSARTLLMKVVTVAVSRGRELFACSGTISNVDHGIEDGVSRTGDRFDAMAVV